MAVLEILQMQTTAALKGSFGSLVLFAESLSKPAPVLFSSPSDNDLIQRGYLRACSMEPLFQDFFPQDKRRFLLEMNLNTQSNFIPLHSGCESKDTSVSEG